MRSELVQGRATRKRRLHPQELHRDESPSVSIMHTTVHGRLQPLHCMCVCIYTVWADNCAVHSYETLCVCMCVFVLNNFRERLAGCLEDITSGPAFSARLAISLLMCSRPLPLNWILTWLHHCWVAIRSTFFFFFARGCVSLLVKTIQVFTLFIRFLRVFQLLCKVFNTFILSAIF